MRQIVLDTETTGLEVAEGHRIIEVGCIELLNRRLTQNRFHFYLNPDREIDPGAVEVHGITNQFLADKPRFAEISSDLLNFLKDAELIIHNAPFDVGFLDAEFTRVNPKWVGISKACPVTDTLQMARKLHPGQKNNLDALCRRYAVDNSQRDLHGALLDAEILAEVYLAMTGGQASLSLGAQETLGTGAGKQRDTQIRADRPALRVIPADAVELAAHSKRLEAIAKAAGAPAVWQQLEPNPESV
ncbi:MAG: DNA polymerase III subunit epsilon [Gammaproteobacteria bacterium]|nr:DNA polymerase III subunit epsilon [Gammaproteobacteria bacterium]